jgi:drug/metabolite transporter (DMT)-like permease
MGSGIAMRLGATAMFSCMGLFVRLASAEVPVGQIMFFRSSFALFPIVIYLWLRRQIPGGLRTRRPGAHLARGLVGLGSMTFSFTSLAYLPLAYATALSFLGPLLVVPAAMLFLRERPQLIVIAVSLCGFLGVVLMLIPAFTGASLDRLAIIGVGAGLASAAGSALSRVQIKALTATEAPAAIAFYFALLCSTLSAATWLLGWAEPSPKALIFLIGAGLIGGLAHILMTEAIALAPASSLAPFEYTAMLWALLFDALVFAALPSLGGFVGAALIVGAAVTVAFADMAVSRARRGATP